MLPALSARGGVGDRPSVPDARRPARPLRGAGRVGVGAVVAVVAVQLAAPSVWSTWPWLPFAVGLLAGLPHGALDHLVPWWAVAARGRGLSGAARMGGVLLAYVALAAGTFALARLWPVPAISALLLGSVVHFGTGETAVHDLRAGRRGPAGRWPGFGAVVVVGPLALWPATVAPVLDVLAPGSASVLLDPAVRWPAAALTGLAALTGAVRGARAGRVAEVGELALLVALVVLVPPLPAFGIYFGAWHGLRHLARLVALDPANAGDLRAGRLARPWARIGAQAALPTAAVLAALGVLLAVPGVFPGAVAGLESAGLALVLALTVPHMIVVAALDRWERSGPLASPPP